MSLPRFYLPDLVPHSILALSGTEASHASKVLRLKPGESVVAFDGKGHESHATIHAVDRREVSILTTETRFCPRDHDGRLRFCVALPKGDRQRSTIEKLVELGTDQLIPLESKRSIASIDEGNKERLERYVLEACKQCHRNRLMEIANPCTVESIRSLAVSSCWILHPYSVGGTVTTIDEATKQVLSARPSHLTLIVGPEGGFTSDEVEQMVRHGASTLSLGERILRVETAVTVAATIADQWLSASNY